MRDFIEFLWEEKWLTALILGLFLLFGWMMYSSGEDCTAKGGELVQTGSTTTFITSGNVLIPITSPIYACNKE